MIKAALLYTIVIFISPSPPPTLQEKRVIEKKRKKMHFQRCHCKSAIMKKSLYVKSIILEKDILADKYAIKDIYDEYILILYDIIKFRARLKV